MPMFAPASGPACILAVTISPNQPLPLTLRTYLDLLAIRVDELAQKAEPWERERIVAVFDLTLTRFSSLGTVLVEVLQGRLPLDFSEFPVHEIEWLSDEEANGFDDEFTLSEWVSMVTPDEHLL